MNTAFTYTASKADGTILKGKIMAATRDEVYTALYKQGLFPIRARASITDNLALKSLLSFNTPSLFQLRQVCLQLALMERAGVPLLQSLNELSSSAPSKKLRGVFAGVHRLVQDGSRFSDALEHYQRIFGDVFIGIIRTGEQLGQLRKSFEDLSVHLKWKEDTQKKVRQAMTYPIILSVGVLLAIVVLMSVLVPKVTVFLGFLNIELPAATRSLVVVSNFSQNYGIWVVLLGIIGVISVIVARVSSPRFGFIIDKNIRHIPFFGKTFEDIALAHFAKQMALLSPQKNGVENNLKLAASSVTNRFVKMRLNNAHRDILQGMPLSGALARYDLFPFSLQKILEMSEHSAQLSKGFEEIAAAYTMNIDIAVEKATNTLRPLLLLIAAAALIWVVLGTLMPLYSVMQKMQM